MQPLSPDDRARLAAYEEKSPLDKTDEERLDEIELRTRRAAEDKAAVWSLIPQVFPEKRGEPKVIGRLTAVVRASGYTREYVARIRDHKVKP